MLRRLRDCASAHGCGLRCHRRAFSNARSLLVRSLSSARKLAADGGAPGSLRSPTPYIFLHRSACIVHQCRVRLRASREHVTSADQPKLQRRLGARRPTTSNPANICLDGEQLPLVCSHRCIVPHQPALNPTPLGGTASVMWNGRHVPNRTHFDTRRLERAYRRLTPRPRPLDPNVQLLASHRACGTGR